MSSKRVLHSRRNLKNKTMNYLQDDISYDCDLSVQHFNFHVLYFMFVECCNSTFIEFHKKLNCYFIYKDDAVVCKIKLNSASKLKKTNIDVSDIAMNPFIFNNFKLNIKEAISIINESV